VKSRRALFLAPLQIAQALVGLGAIAAFTRLMSPDEFGRYALALSASMFAHTLLFTWAEAAAFRFFSAARAEKRLADHFATLLVLALALGAIVLAATTALLSFVGISDDVVALSAFAAGAAVFRFLTRITRESDRAAFDIGRYAALETAYLAIGFAAGVAFAPMLLNAYEDKGADAARAIAGRAFTLFAALALPAAIGLALVAQPLAAVLVGEGLRIETARALPWLALAGAAAGFNLYYWSEAFQLTRRTGLRAMLMVAPGVLQLGLTLLLAPRFGAAGAGMTSAAGAICASVLLVTFGRRLIALPAPLGELARIALASVAMAALVTVLPATGGAAELTLKATAGVAAYIAAALVFDVLEFRTHLVAFLRTHPFRLAVMERRDVRSW
jgi:O-antigen/teichoic acid export membrane protein